ncbi:camp-binding domain-like protein [Rozella allomycis CSF55]|nr:camp-binding domain-like protein [Rozella allomycis CSF55]
MKKDGKDNSVVDVNGICSYIKTLDYKKTIIEDEDLHFDFMSQLSSFCHKEPKKVAKHKTKPVRLKPIDAVVKVKEGKVNDVKPQNNQDQVEEDGQNFKSIPYDHSLAKDLLSKLPHARTKLELRQLYHLLKQLPAFSKLSAFVLEQLCSVMHFNYSDADRVVFLQGDVGTSWYVILKGKVSVSVSKTGQATDAVVVKILGEGEGFGDLALINDKPRAATIITIENCEFARIEKDDYNRILRFLHDRDIKQRSKMLYNLKEFEKWTPEAMKQIAGLFDIKKYNKGQIIIRENEKADNFFIVKGGLCEGSRLYLGEDKPKSVIVERFDARDYFGERCFNRSIDGSIVTYGVTIRAIDDVTLIVFSGYDAVTRFNNTFIARKYLKWTQDDLKILYQQQCENDRMRREKSKILNGVIKERHKDPARLYKGNMTNDQLKFQKCVWHY